MSDRPLPALLRGRPFTFAEAREEGVARSRLRAPDVANPHRGIYDADAATSSLVHRCERALRLLGPDRRFSHLTAARLWGMPVPLAYRDDEDLHVVAWSGAGRLRRPGIVGWRSDEPLPAVILGGLPVVAASEVWCQLAVPGAADGRSGRLDIRDLTAAADYLLTGPYSPSGGRVPIVTRADLGTAVGRRRGGRGVIALREALQLARVGAHSPKETEVRLLLVEHGLPEPDVQVPVTTAAGIRHADLGYPHARVLIEYEGDHHRTDRRRWRDDTTRRQLFEDAEYRVLWITADDLVDRLGLAARVRRALGARYYSP